MKSIAAATLIAAASAAPEASYGYGIGIYNPHATSGELIEVGGTTVPDTTASVKAAAADHLAAKTLYSGYGGYGYGGYGGYGYGGYGKRSAEAWVPDNLAQVPIGGGLCTAVGALAATSGAVVPCFTPEFQAVALAHQQKGKREAEPWYGWRGFSGAPIAGGALVIGQNSVTPDYTPEQKGAAWGLNWGLVKREADSEADAYYGYGGYGLGYGLGYGGYGYGGLGYGYGKRSATEKKKTATLTVGRTCFGYDAKTCAKLQKGHKKREADSEADAYYGYGGLYGGYGGYGLGYGYGGYGYGK